MDAMSYSYADKQAKRIKKFINDPDSTSGVLTVPKVIASGENVTIPAGRVAVLPNVQVDGTLNIEGEVFIPSGATFSKVVETEGNQTITGVKTFSSSPIVPTPTTGTQAVNKDYVDSKSTLPIGTILNGYTIFDNCIVAFGGEFNRADYPKLWAYLQANPSLVKTQAQWTTENTTNGMCGYYSDGNGTTTFRVPNLDKAFLRHDSRSIASYQEGSYTAGDDSGNSPSSFGLNNSDDNLLLFRERMNWDNLSTVNIGNSNLKSVWVGSVNVVSYSTNQTVFGVTRPKNIAVLPLIAAK